MKTTHKIPLSFYQKNDVLQISRELLGKFLFTRTQAGEITGGMIIETEAYRGPEDRASHAYNNRRTARTEVMFHQGGAAYVYLCYGIHHLFNIVTHCEGIPHAVLIRAIEPLEGISTMQLRRKVAKNTPSLASGPGSLCKALGIDKTHNGISLCSDTIWLEDRGIAISPDQIACSPRIGVSYAKEDALLPWRFYLPSPTRIKKPL